jgi:plasmid maintenance system antidote protein VapI
MTAKTGSKKEAQEQNALQEIEFSVTRLKAVCEKKWWLGLTADEQLIFGKLFGRIATVAQGIEAKSEPKFKAPLAPMLDTLSNWVSDIPKLSPANSKSAIEIKEKLDKQVALVETTPLPVESSVSGPKSKNPSASAIDPKIINKMTQIESRFEELQKQINSNLSISRNILEQEGLYFEENKNLYQVSLKAIADQVINVSSISEKQAVIIKDSMKESSENLKNLENKFKLFEEQLAVRMHIRDSVQILEIKEEVERFVVSDLIRKISLALMPAIEALKDAKSEEIPKAIDDLGIRCANAGLIPIERLFS